MGLDGDHLLKRLQPVVRPCGPEFPPRHRDPIEQADFARLVEMASRGEIASGRPVTARTQDTLDRPRLDRLSTVCDALEAAGLERGAVLMEGRVWVLDVPERAIADEVRHEDAGTVKALGGVVRVLGPDEEDLETAPSGPQPRNLRANPAVPPGILAQLERGGRGAGA